MNQILFFFLLLPIAGFSQISKQDSIWKAMSFFEGNWKGTGEGEPGFGTYERSYQFILNKNFIEVSNRSSYPPKGNEQKGEVHEDRGFISYDKNRKTFVLRQFHVEGFVNQYHLDSVSADGKTLVFISEAIENIPAGWRAKETYHFSGNNSFTEVFELAPPGGKFDIYTKAVFSRDK